MRGSPGTSLWPAAIVGHGKIITGPKKQPIAYLFLLSMILLYSADHKKPRIAAKIALPMVRELLYTHGMPLHD